MSKQVADIPPFPTMLRKMWSGGEVQKWIDENIAPLLEATPASTGAERNQCDGCNAGWPAMHISPDPLKQHDNIMCTADRYASQPPAQDEAAVFGLLSEIRAAAGDPQGRLTHGELVEHVKRMKATSDLLADFFGWFNCHYCEPSAHPDHPWCRLGSALSAQEQSQ